jgi:DNA-3-methyladenine glycosylase II
MPLHTAAGFLTPTAPFDFNQSLRFAARFHPRESDPGLTAHSLTRAVRVAGHTLVFSVESEGSVEAPRLAYALYAAAPITPAIQAAAADRIAFYLSLHDNLRPFYAVAQADPPFLPVLDALYGYHQVKFLTPFENAVWAILTQRNQWTTAQRMAGALVTRYGDHLSVAGQAHWAYPEAATLAGADPEEVKHVIRHRPKGTQVVGVAQAFAHADEAFLRSAPHAEVEAWLLKIPGIGPWSASFILLRGLGRPDRLPPGDRYIQAGFSRFYGPADLHERAEHYGAWRGWWGHYLRAVE